MEPKKNEIEPNEDPEFYDALEEQEDHPHNEDAKVQTHNEVHDTQFAVGSPPGDGFGKDSHPETDEDLVNLLASTDTDSLPKETDPVEEKKMNNADSEPGKDNHPKAARALSRAGQTKLLPSRESLALASLARETQISPLLQANNLQYNASQYNDCLGTRS